MTKLFCDLCEKETSTLYNYTVPGYVETKAMAHGTTIMTFASPSSIQIEICEECQEKIRKLFNIHK